MKKIKTFLISIIFTFIFYGNVVAGTGEATEYKINIYKIFYVTVAVQHRRAMVLLLFLMVTQVILILLIQLLEQLQQV